MDEGIEGMDVSSCGMLPINARAEYVKDGNGATCNKGSAVKTEESVANENDMHIRKEREGKNWSMVFSISAF